MKTTLFIFASSVLACTPDLVLDRFTSEKQAVVDGALRYVNTQGGDYGVSGGSFDIEASQTPEGGSIAVKMTAADNFFFFKTNKEACDDLTNYTAIRFDMVAPVGSTFQFTLTQKAPDCIDRIEDGDSVYKPVTEYIVPNGQKQTVVFPLKDFAMNVKGKPYDFKHFKDFTIVNQRPLGAEIKYSNIVLVGDCSAPPKPSVTPSPTGSSNSSKSETPSPKNIPGDKPNNPVSEWPGNKSGASALVSSLLTLFAALMI